MSDLTKGFSFSGVSPNNNVTAAKLNALVDDATINVEFLTGKTEATSAAAADMFLFWDSASNAFMKIKRENLVPVSAGALSGSVGLVMSSNAVSPNTKVDVTANEIAMRTTGGLFVIAQTFSATCDIALYSGGSTVNGRDAATELGSTWYYVYAISTGTTHRLLFSTSATSPTLPTGYTYKCLLGAWRNDDSSNLRYGVQRGNRMAMSIVKLPTVNSGSVDVPFTTGGEFSLEDLVAALNWQTVDLTRCIPPGAAAVSGLFSCHSPSTAERGMGVASQATGSMNAFNAANLGLFGTTCDIDTGGSQTFNNAGANLAFIDLPITVSQQIACASFNAPANGFSMRITGYRMNL